MLGWGLVFVFGMVLLVMYIHEYIRQERNCQVVGCDVKHFGGWFGENVSHWQEEKGPEGSGPGLAIKFKLGNVGDAERLEQSS